METEKLIEKFGGRFVGDDETYRKGTHHFSAEKIANNFVDYKEVLETCSGAGFVTIYLARNAEHVIAVDINPDHLEQARENVGLAGLSSRVTFINGDATDPLLHKLFPDVDSAFLDPDWTRDGSLETPYARILSEMHPDGEVLFNNVTKLTANIAFRIPRTLNLDSLSGMPPHEIEEHVSSKGKLKFFVAYFGDLRKQS